MEKTDFNSKLNGILASMPHMSLEETGKVRLMDRTDTKYIANKELLLRFLELTKGEYSVQTTSARPVAIYTTTYWDTTDHHFYLLHHNGARPRIKVRVRTYLDTDTSFLEVKNKDNHGKTHKSRLRLAAPDEVETDEDEQFLEEEASMDLSDLHPCLTNHFSRVTLINNAQTERLTIDFDVNFKNEENGNSITLGNLVIIELKRSGKSDSPALDAFLKLRIKPQGFSKYCIGTFLTNPDVKRNIFKKRFVKICRAAGRRETLEIQKAP